MPRPRRVQVADAAYHITARGNNGEVTFRDAEDFRLYLRLLADLRKRAGIRILAYTLMSNHVHLVVVTTAENLSRAVQWLHGRYAAVFNRKYGRTGHLFGARFHSTLIEHDVYLLEATRYVHLNPVRAGVVRQPEDYPYSSYGAYVDGEGPDAFLEPDLVLALLSADPRQARLAYLTFVCDRLPPTSIQRQHHPPPDPLGVIVATVADALGVPRQALWGRRRPMLPMAIILALARDLLDLSPQQLAQAIGIAPGGVNVALWRFRQFAEREPRLRSQVEELKLTCKHRLEGSSEAAPSP